ncbi:MAG TPA: FHA domain-containing protein [Lacipirellulaceae bacterium]|nr:FHA domain-containing protein [Lacipirellulaceae bacterium]
MIDSKLPQRVELEVVRGQAQRRRRPVVSPAFLIGSSSECDLVLGASQFAEVYVCLIVRPSGVTVRQVGEGPAMHINGMPTADAKLRDGDRLAAGPFEFIVHISPTSEMVSPSTVPIEPPRANRWTSAQHIAEPDALQAAAKLIHDIRAALDEHPAMRRPA